MTCTGACCAVLTLPITAMAQLKSGEVNDSGFILDMLVELEPEQVFDRLERLGYANFEQVTAEEYGRWARETAGHGTEWLAFTCRHWDETTRLCKVYEERPGMCRRHPNTEACRACGLAAKPTQGAGS